MNIIVLGCGPAGLTAAWAAINMGHNVTIISKKWEPSILRGCQYLHAPIPGFENVQKTRVQYSLNGTTEQYRRKVYGEQWHGRVSPEDFIGEHDAWDIRETYRLMFKMIDETNLRHDRVTVVEMDIVHGDLTGIKDLGPHGIISTIPAKSLCYNRRHTFTKHAIYARGIESPNVPGASGRNRIICDGTEDVPWYRISDVFGYVTTEWSVESRNLHYSPLTYNAVNVFKPLSTDCDCHPGVIRAGRYGEWDKSVLVHQVYGKVKDVLS